jgi:GAF domain-containing protein
VPAFPESGLAAGREALRRFLAGDDDLPSMLTKITLIANETIPGASATSITIVHRSEPRTPAFTEKRVLAPGPKPPQLGDGPCLSALRHQGVEQVRTASDERWPAFSQAALDVGIAAVLSAPMMDDHTTKGALNVYSESTFGDDAPELARLFADQLGIAAVNATLYVEGALLADQLRQALESRAVIEQAKGILMAAERCGPEPAFDILRRASQGQNRKLRDIAADIVQRYTDEHGPGAAPA